MPSTTTTDPIFDCDNHYYEALDAFTRHVPDAMKERCVQWADVEGRKRHVVGGKIDFSVGNPTFDPCARAGILSDLVRVVHPTADQRQLRVRNDALDRCAPDATRRPLNYAVGHHLAPIQEVGCRHLQEAGCRGIPQRLAGGISTWI